MTRVFERVTTALTPWNTLVFDERGRRIELTVNPPVQFQGQQGRTFPTVVPEDSCGKWHDGEHKRCKDEDHPPGLTANEFHRAVYGGNIYDCPSCLGEVSL